MKAKTEVVKRKYAWMRNTALTAITVTTFYGWSEDVKAQTTGAGEDQLSGEIIVTARKREERAIDVPASLNVFSGEALESAGVKSLVDLQYQTPGLKVAVGGSSARISLRGVGTNIGSGGPSVAVHMDGIYIPDTRFALTETFDLGRIEVLKGPEGTLYGRNATGGAINIISKAPGSDFAADGYIGYGSNNLVTLQGGVTVPLDDRGGIRLSGLYANDDGYTTNIHPAGGEIDARGYRGIRLRGQYALTETLTADITAQYSHDKSTVGFGFSNNPDSPVYASIAPQRESPRRISNDTPPVFDQKTWLLSGTLSLDLGDVTLKSLTGFLDYQSLDISDIDGSGGFIGYTVADAVNRFFSQEFQISGGHAGGITWTAGAYYSRQRMSGNGYEIDSDYPLDDPYLYTDQTLTIRSRSKAVFGEVTVPLNDRTSFLAGARYTDEKQWGESIFDAPLFIPAPIATDATTKGDAFTPKLLVEFLPYDGGRLYASVTRGFKSGGVNLATIAETYKPERIWAYEIGTKNSLANGLAEFSLAGFYYDYTDLQLRTRLFTPTGIITRITNAAKASIYGIEAAATVRPAQGLTLDFNGAYLDTELKNYISPVTDAEISGLPMPLTPKWSFTAGAQYKATIGNSGSVTARAEVTYQSEVNFPQFTDFERERQAGYALVNANLRYDFPGDQVYVALIGRNLTNTLYKTQRFFYAGFADTEFFGTPRIIEARVGFLF
ncbi:TonB-dependent receptor [Sphingosinicella sp.]|uniref:TonB-dependent receptor n=1 Tax=Sphingosinicella sp. TaxID=1917971 RepID=UPI0035B45B54